MPYSKLLQKIIADTDYKNSDIIKKCKEEYNVIINETHFSKILNNHRKPPKVEVSKAIAKVCEVDERLLILEGYIDKAPKEIQEIFRNLQFNINTISALLVSNIRDLEDEKLKIIKKYLDNEYIASSIIFMLDEMDNSTSFIKNNIDIEENLLNTNISFHVPQGILINDDSMSPIIEEGNKVILDLKKPFKISDFVAYKNNKSENIKVRILTKNNSTYVMIPINRKYNQEIYSEQDIKILGKVSQVIKDL